MQKPQFDPDVADAAPTDLMLAHYDHEHTVTYLRLLDEDAEGAELARGRTDRIAYRSHSRADAGLEGIREPSVAREMDDRARLPAPLARWRIFFAKLMSGLPASAMHIPPSFVSPHG
jgi:hypothetical protein